MKKRSTEGVPKRTRRKKIDQKVERQILIRCRRRCALCYGFSGITTENLQGQIAHINHDRSDNREENLAYLCMPHHDAYDSKTSQSKGITSGELIHWKERTEILMETWDKKGSVDADLTIEVDFDEFDKAREEQFLESLAILIRAKKSLNINHKTRGSVRLVVSIDAEDLSKLLQEFDRGNLSDLKVSSAKPHFQVHSTTPQFYSNWGIVGTFSKQDAMRLFETAEYLTDINIDNYRMRFVAKVSSVDRNRTVLMSATYYQQKLSYSEPLIISKEDVDDWAIENPFSLLKSFLSKRGVVMSQSGFAPTTFIMDRTIYIPSALEATIGFEEALRKLITTQLSFKGRFYWDIRSLGNGKHRILKMYCLPDSVIASMRPHSSPAIWFC